MSEPTERLLLRFMVVMLRGLITLANERLTGGQTNEIIELKRDAIAAAYPNGMPERFSKYNL